MKNDGFSWLPKVSREIWVSILSSPPSSTTWGSRKNVTKSGKWVKNEAKKLAGLASATKSTKEALDVAADDEADHEEEEDHVTGRRSCFGCCLGLPESVVVFQGIV